MSDNGAHAETLTVVQLYFSAHHSNHRHIQAFAHVLPWYTDMQCYQQQGFD